MRASYAAAGEDLVDLGRHAVVGETRTHQHEGTRSYRVSPLAMLPFAVYDLVRLEPVSAAAGSSRASRAACRPWRTR